MAYYQIAIAVIGMGTAAAGAASAGGAAERAARRQGAAEMALTHERLRQLKKEETSLAGTTRATLAGSGVKADVGSPLTILAEQAREFSYERSITSRVGASNVAGTLQAGKAAATAYKYQSYANLAEGASKIFSLAKGSGSASSGFSNANSVKTG